MEYATVSMVSETKPFRIEGKLRSLSREEASVKDRCCKMAGDLIALGKFLRDHSIENPLEHDLRKAAKGATEKKFYELHRYLLAAEEAAGNEFFSGGRWFLGKDKRPEAAETTKGTPFPSTSAIQVNEAEAKNVPIDKQIFVES